MKPIEIKFLPWIELLNDLEKKLGKKSYISKALNLQFSTTQRWFSGGEPSYRFGVAILELHSQLCGKKRTKELVEKSSSWEEKRKTAKKAISKLNKKDKIALGLPL